MNPARLVLMAFACLLLVACATAKVQAPQAPDESILNRAEAMVAKARTAGAAQFAPDALASARRRLTVARMILLRRVGQSLGDQEHQRLQRLADAAYLDARLALVRTQAGAVGYQSDQLSAQLNGRDAAADEGDAR